MNVIVVGAKGRMGSLLINYLNELKETVIPIDSDNFTDITDHVNAEVIIDFSNPEALASLIEVAIEKQLPIVIGTTGYNKEQEKLIETASRKIPIFKSANFSIGIYIMTRLLKEAYPLIKNQYDIDITEKHHRYKKDAPSGTALLLANTLKNSDNDALVLTTSNENGPRKANTIGMQSLRSGTIVGDHAVLFSGEYDQIEITHKAQSKTIFVEGATQAAYFIIKQKPGLYTMDDLMEERGI